MTSIPQKPPALNVRDIRAVGVEVPMTYALGTSRGAVTRAPLLLIDLETEEGITGRCWLFCYLSAAAPAIAKILGEVLHVTKGARIAPVDLWAKLAQRFALIGVQGIVRMAMAGFEVACWDALATAAGLPLAAFLGGQPKRVRAYNSCGLGLMTAPEAVADEAEKLLARGFYAVKLRLGYPTLKQDLAALHAVRRRVPDSVSIMVDYNQALTVAEALARGRALDQEALAAGAADYVMPDMERIGGVAGWQRAAALAAAHRIEMSSHLFPEVSAHLLAATPTAHWLEWVDWAESIVEEPLVIKDGFAVVPDRAGVGLSWKREAVDRYRM
jgi:mandelate racemase